MRTVTETRPRLCSDKAHDDRWCSTCEAMWDGIELFAIQMLAPVEEEHLMGVFVHKMKKRAAVDETAEGSDGA